jgi:hypothetical protein
MPPPGEHLTGIDYFFLVVPVTIVLFGWIIAVIWASFHPQVHHPNEAARSALARGAADEEPAAGADQAPAGSVPRQQGAERQVPRQPGSRPRAGQPQQPGREPTGAGQPPGPGGRTGSGRGQ